MRKIFFDVETTDLRPGQICQLAYICEDGDQLSLGNWFFTVRYVTPTAFRIHGLSRKGLEKLSNGEEFDDYAEEIAQLFEGSKRIGHNVHFDRLFLQTELRRSGYVLTHGEWYCTMQHFTNICKLFHSQKDGYKFPSLVELMQFTQVTVDDVIAKSQELFHDTTRAHDARYDTVAVWLCYKNAVELGYIQE